MSISTPINYTDRQTDILLTEKKSHYRLICLNLNLWNVFCGDKSVAAFL